MAGREKPLDQRLAWIMTQGNLTVMDLSRLMDRPYATVWGWVNGASISGAALDIAYVMAWIEKLEGWIRKGNNLPVPRLAPSERISYVEGLMK